jgi:hypothetical protein
MTQGLLLGILLLVTMYSFHFMSKQTSAQDERKLKCEYKNWKHKYECDDKQYQKPEKPVEVAKAPVPSRVPPTVNHQSPHPPQQHQPHPAKQHQHKEQQPAPNNSPPPAAAASFAKQALGDPAVVQALAFAKDRAMDNTVIVVQVNEAWDLVMYNWIASAHRLGIKHYILISVDAPLAQRLSTQGAPVVHIKVEKKEWQANYVYHQALWASRWRVVAGLVEHGYNVVHADADAPFVKNPAPVFALPGDIVVSRDVPEKEWLQCMGWVMLRSTPPAKAFLQRFLTVLKSTKHDDQKAWNYAMFDLLHLKWDQGLDPTSSGTFNRVVVGRASLPTTGFSSSSLLAHHHDDAHVQVPATAASAPLAPPAAPAASASSSVGNDVAAAVVVEKVDPLPPPVVVVPAAAALSSSPPDDSSVPVISPPPVKPMPHKDAASGGGGGGGGQVEEMRPIVENAVERPKNTGATRETAETTKASNNNNNNNNATNKSSLKSFVERSSQQQQVLAWSSSAPPTPQQLVDQIAAKAAVRLAEMSTAAEKVQPQNWRSKQRRRNRRRRTQRRHLLGGPEDSATNTTREDNKLVVAPSLQTPTSLPLPPPVAQVATATTRAPSPLTELLGWRRHSVRNLRDSAGRPPTPHVAAAAAAAAGVAAPGSPGWWWPHNGTSHGVVVVSLVANTVIRRNDCNPNTIKSSEAVIVHCRKVGSLSVVQTASPSQKAQGLQALGAWFLVEEGKVRAAVKRHPRAWDSFLGDVLLSK